MTTDQESNVIQADPTFVESAAARRPMLGKGQSDSDAMMSKEDPAPTIAVLMSLTSSGEFENTLVPLRAGFHISDSQSQMVDACEVHHESLSEPVGIRPENRFSGPNAASDAKKFLPSLDNELHACNYISLLH